MGSRIGKNTGAKGIQRIEESRGTEGRGWGGMEIDSYWMRLTADVAGRMVTSPASGTLLTFEFLPGILSHFGNGLSLGGMDSNPLPICAQAATPSIRAIVYYPSI